jgi:hypothetical protein
MRTALWIPALLIMASVANAQGAPTDEEQFEEGPPVPPIKEESIGIYCIHRNLLYSIGDVLCIGGQGLVCVPSSGPGSGGRAYWSSVPVNRSDVNWTPPARCGR